MKITNETRTKIFAPYLGQKFIYNGSLGVKRLLTGINWGFDLEDEQGNNFRIDKSRLLLRPLSDITEEQMKKCLQLLGYTRFKDVKYDGGYIVWQQKLQYSYTTKSLLLDHRMPAIVYQFLVDEGFDTKKYLLYGKTLHEAGLANYKD